MAPILRVVCLPRRENWTEIPLLDKNARALVPSSSLPSCESFFDQAGISSRVSRLERM
jgi:hypothetical protein